MLLEVENYVKYAVDFKRRALHVLEKASVFYVNTKKCKHGLEKRRIWADDIVMAINVDPCLCCETMTPGLGGFIDKNDNRTMWCPECIDANNL